MFAEDRAAGNSGASPRESPFGLKMARLEDWDAQTSKALKLTSGYCGVPQMLDTELQNLMFALPISGFFGLILSFCSPILLF